jgi:Flp pilus assembly protein TadD
MVFGFLDMARWSFCVKSRLASHSKVMAVALLVAVCASGCVKSGNADITGSINQTYASMTEAEKRGAAEQLGRRYDASPDDKLVGLSYARLLRDLNQINQAIAVLQTVALRHGNDRDVAAAYGKALADGGRFAEAQEVLARAHSPDRPDWRVLSTLGAINDQLGKHDEAQQYYHTALQLQPNDPGILSNLGLSYALSNRLREAETVMQQAISHPAASPKVRGNMAVVLALQGKYQEAERMASQDLSPADAAANMVFLRSMIVQNNSWRQMKSLDGKDRDSKQKQAQR